MIKKHLKVFFKSLTKFEAGVLLANLAIAILLSILNIVFIKPKESEPIWPPYIAIFANILSILSCIFAAKKMILVFPTGIICSCFMIPINYVQRKFGLTIMSGFDIIMQIVLWIIWYKTSDNKIDIKPKKASVLVCIIYFISLCICTGVLTYVESFEWFQKFWENGSAYDTSPQDVAQMFFDAGVLIFTIGVFYPLIKKYNQVWWLYLLMDVFGIIVWSLELVTEPTNNVTAWFMITNSLSMTSLALVSMRNWKTTQS